MKYEKDFDETALPSGKYFKENELTQEDLDFINQDCMFVCDKCGDEIILSDRNQMTIELKDGRKIEYEICTGCVNIFNEAHLK